MSAEPLRQATVEDYLEIERASEEKHEFFDGQIYSMVGATFHHIMIVTNLVRELSSILQDRQCFVGSSDWRIQVSAYDHYTYPDVAVVCGEPSFVDERRDMIDNPTVIVEVLSETTESYDRGEKFARYRSLPSLAEYVLVAQHRVSVEHHARQSDGHWLTTYVEDLDASLPLPVLECELSVAQIYDKVDLQETSAGD